jgi:hypothetical protein
VKESKLLLRFSLTTAFVFCVFSFLGQSTGPLLADGALVLQPVSYSWEMQHPHPPARSRQRKQLLRRESPVCKGFRLL